jgi:hypothetical protein
MGFSRVGINTVPNLDTDFKLRFRLKRPFQTMIFVIGLLASALLCLKFLPRSAHVR